MTTGDGSSTSLMPEMIHNGTIRTGRFDQKVVGHSISGGSVGKPYGDDGAV